MDKFLNDFRKVNEILVENGYSHRFKFNSLRGKISIWLSDENDFCVKTYLEFVSLDKAQNFIEGVQVGLNLGIM